ncbi:MAG: FAD-dependent oxidoreductase [Clostridiaceae bacterium]|nr:FAD-dependent oxidoreductase [Clostridiaceae bacterium]
MNNQKLIVIGAVAAGTKAASKAKRDNPALEVKVFTRERYISYAGCGLPYYIGGIIKEKHELLVRSPEDFKREQGIDIYTEQEVKKIDASGKKVSVLDLRSGEAKEYYYDKLIIATGASPIIPPLGNVNLANIFTLRSVSDAFAIRELVDSGAAKKAVVVGGGFIGLETAENLIHRGLDVTIVELVPHILPPFDEEIALYAQNHMKDRGARILTGEKVTGFEGSNGKVAVVKTSAGDIEADMVILSIGVRPNTAVAAEAGVELGVTKAIKVNKYMETNIKDIYAAGDCAENTNLITGKPAWYPMGSTSNKTGRISGHNAALGPQEEALKESLEGVLGTTIVRLFEVNAAKTGLSERDAIKEGYQIETVLVPANDRAHYFPGYKQIITKLVAEKDTHKVLGAQIVGEGVVDKPIDTIATAITLGARVEDLAKLDLAYAPPFSMAMSSTIMSANVMLNKLTGRMESLKAQELPGKLADGSINVLDVREEVEFFISAIPGSNNIPMNELEARIDEIDKGKETIVLVCKVGKRAYTAYLKLKGLGFTNLKILEGGTCAYPYELV